MFNSTTNTYQMKRDIINFSEKLCKNSSKPESKFVTDMIYGISKSKDILLSSIADALDENIKKINTIERLSDNLTLDIDSSIQKDFVSSNSVTYEGLDKVISLLDERNLVGIFVLDRGYDSNDIFNYYFSKNQYLVIRLTEKRKVYQNHKWHKITTLRDSFKGKIKMKLMFQGEEKECSASVTRVQITAKKTWINVIFVYGLGDTPMMIASNIPIKSKEEVIKIARLYMNRWRIEEYFKFKKQEYHFENFRVRTLKSINNLNKMLTYTIGLVALLSEKIGKREFVNRIIKESKSLKNSVFLCFYQIARGIYNILKMAKNGIRDWEHIRKQKVYDGQLSLL